jgi:allantoinase
MSNPRVPYRMSTEQPILAPPNGKPLIVHVVVNIEHWPFDRPMPRKILPGPHGVDRSPDVPNFAWVEYGMRAGLPRILKALGDRGLAASAAINASVVETYPTAAEAALKAGWEFMGHGLTQRAMQLEEDEPATIAKALGILERFTGKKTRGWLGPGLNETDHTPELLQSHGVEYICDWLLDDVPNWMRTRNGPVIAMPYSFEFNDVVIWTVDKHSSDEMHLRVVDSLATFDKELHAQPRILTLPLHPHVVGVAHRMAHFERTLDLLAARPDCVFMTGSEITDWFVGLAAPGDPALAPETAAA